MHISSALQAGERTQNALRQLARQWKSSLSLGDGEKQEAVHAPDVYSRGMDYTQMIDNTEKDLSPASGLVVTAHRGGLWTERYEGDSKVGCKETWLPDGKLVVTKFSEESIDYLWLKPGPQGVEALHDHHDRTSGQSWAQHVPDYRLHDRSFPPLLLVHGLGANSLS